MKKINLPSISSVEEHGISISNILRSILFSFTLSIGLLFVFAVVLTYTNFPESSIPTVVLMVTIISIIYAAQKSARNSKNRGWLIGGITGLTYVILLYIISMIFTQRPVFDSNLFVIMLISLIAGAVGGIIGINLKKPEKRYR